MKCIVADVMEKKVPGLKWIFLLLLMVCFEGILRNFFFFFLGCSVSFLKGPHLYV